MTNIHSSHKAFSNSFIYKLHALVINLDRGAEKLLMEKTETTYSQFLVLMSVLECGKEKCMQKTIAEHLGHTEAAVSRQVSNLTKRGLIQREYREPNKREKVMTLTVEGKAVLDEAFEVLQDGSDRILQAISQKDLQMTSKILDKLLETVCKVSKEKES